jgi:hypothetical protein
MRLNKTGNDPHISLDHVTIDERRRAVVHRAELDVRRRIFGFVIEHAIVRYNCRREQFLQFRARVGPMRAELVEQGDILARHMREMLEQPRDDPLIRCGASNVAETDADAVGPFDRFMKRRRADRIFQRTDHGFPFIRQPGRVRRRNHRRPALGKLYGQIALAIGKVNSHQSGRAIVPLMAFVAKDFQRLGQRGRIAARPSRNHRRFGGASQATGQRKRRRERKRHPKTNPAAQTPVIAKRAITAIHTAGSNWVSRTAIE